MKENLVDQELKNFNDTKINSNKFDFDLYKEEDNKVEKVFRIRHFGANKSEKWRVYEDNKIIFVLDR